MRGIFDPNRVNYILRTYLPHWRFQERIEEIIRFCKETGTEHVMLFSDAQHLCWNQLTFKEARREIDNIRRAKEKLSEEGIRLGINSTYNMPMSRWDHRQHNDYDYWATLRNGMCEYCTPCLLDPKLETYLAKFYAMFAHVKPDYIYIDDDHRYINQGKNRTWGCFCALHLQKFGALTST